MCCRTKVLPIQQPHFCFTLTFGMTVLVPFFFSSSFSMESTLRLELLLFITHAKHSAWSSWARLYRSVKLACFLFTAHQTDLQFQRKPQTFSTIITCVKSPSMNWNEGEKRNCKAEAMQHKSRKLIFFARYTKYAHISLVWRSVLLKCTWNRIPTIQTVISLVCSTFKTLSCRHGIFCILWIP